MRKGVIQFEKRVVTVKTENGKYVDCLVRKCDADKVIENGKNCFISSSKKTIKGKDYWTHYLRFSEE